MLKFRFRLEFILLTFFWMNSTVAVSIGFDSLRSRLSVGTYVANLYINGALNLEGGTLELYSYQNKIPDRTIHGDNVNFSRGVLAYFPDSASGFPNSEYFLNGLYQPLAGINKVLLSGDDVIRAEPGMVVEAVEVSGNKDNLISGQPTFASDIILQDPNTTLTIAIQSKLNKNIEMNGGAIELGDSLWLDDHRTLLGDGTVRLKGKRFSFGGANLNLGHSILWEHAGEVEINSTVELRHTWTYFGDDCKLNGNGNILDLSLGGTIWVKHGTTLHLTDIKIRGLGSGGFGSIICEDKSSHIRLSNVEIQLDRDYTFTEGGIYVEGPATIVTAENLFTVDSRASLTVDHQTLWYDILAYDDRDNIRPEPAFDTNDSNNWITLMNGGVIRLVAGLGSTGAGEELGDIYFNNDQTKVLTQDIFLSKDRMMYVNAHVVLDGNKHFIHFSRETDPATGYLIKVANTASLTLKNVVLRDFLPAHMGSGPIIYGDGTTIEMAENSTLKEDWMFYGRCVLNGQNHILNLGNYNINLGTNAAALLFENITLDNVGVNNINNIVMWDNASTLSFKDVEWRQDGNFSLTRGRFVVLGLWRMMNDFIFAYETDRVSTVSSNARMMWDTGFTFSYAPTTDNRNLIYLSDRAAEIFMNGAELRSTYTGIILSRGTLVVDHKNTLYNYDELKGRVQFPVTQSISDAITFDNDLTVEFMPDANLTLENGKLNLIS